MLHGAGSWQCASPQLPSCCLHLQHPCSVCRGRMLRVAMSPCAGLGVTRTDHPQDSRTWVSLLGSHPSLIIIKYVLSGLKWPSSGYNLLIGEPAGGQRECALAGQRGAGSALGMAGEGWEHPSETLTSLQGAAAPKPSHVPPALRQVRDCIPQMLSWTMLLAPWAKFSGVCSRKGCGRWWPHSSLLIPDSSL